MSNMRQNGGPHMTQGKVYECSKLEQFVPKVLDFVKYWKCANYFCDCLILYLKEEPQLKCERGDGCEAP